MNPFVGGPYNGSNPATWGNTNYYKLNEQVISNPFQTRIGGKRKVKRKINRRTKKNKKKYVKKSKKGGGFVDERFTFPGLNTSRNIINSTQNMYNTFSGKHLNVSPSPLNQPINRYSGST
jgi:hypothetical protein